MGIEEEEEIAKQRKEVFERSLHVDLVSACTVGNGILRLGEIDALNAANRFNDVDEKISFFIPASGSGSRMFKFLFDWLETAVDTKEVNNFIEIMDSLALTKAYRKNGDVRNFIEELLDKDKINIGEMPKGLIPFHIYNDAVATPFQEYVKQAKELMGERADVHFTIQQNFQENIWENITQLPDEYGDVEVTFSYQEEDTNAFCFNEDGSVIIENGRPLKRPAGHGALLKNLNAIDSDIVLLKNIDNIQHASRSEATTNEWKKLIGLLQNFKSDLFSLVHEFSQEGLNDLNEKYLFLSNDELKEYNESNIVRLAKRPTRICGMVKNEGEPGGGPFWIDSNGKVTKQIVEKVQIENSTDQRKIVEESSHFNPVFIAVSKNDIYNNRLDLNNFVDYSKYFVVAKSHKGKKVIYRELPGLWNGSMSDWNTIFLEIPSEVFSPVKSLLDLDSKLHKA